MNEDYVGIVTRATRACFRILLAVVALYVAVVILKAIWPALLIIGASGSLVTGAWVLLRRWRGM